jgi:2-polyprenyl-3-methyl-5-hydroxy-6-metoxy-1,4-benzoquinol methylase
VRGDPELINTDFIDKPWYNIIELEPNVFSEGTAQGNIIATRTLLRNVDTKGFLALDVGATNGLFSTLLERKGAVVTAYDRVNNFRGQVEQVKEKYNVNFDHVTGLSFVDFCESHHEQGKELFNLVLCSGVLYHAFDPMAMLCHVRGMVHTGGIILLETASLIDENPALYFNAKARYQPFTNYYQPTTGWIDYVSRFIGIRWLSTCYIYHEETKIARVATIGVAESGPIAEPDDQWITHSCHSVDRKEFRINNVEESENYKSRIRPLDNLLYYDSIDAVDVTKTIKSTPSLVYNRRMCELHLSDFE